MGAEWTVGTGRVKSFENVFIIGCLLPQRHMNKALLKKSLS